jgi:dTDP-4-dehydrorhamnose reductase
VNACLDLLIDEAAGIWHLANTSALSWADFALRAADRGRLDKHLIKSVTTEEMNLVARRPCFSALGTERGVPLPNLDSAIDRYFSEGAVNSFLPSNT